MGHGPDSNSDVPCPMSAVLGPLLARCASMSSFATYVIGFVILIVGLAIAAFLLNVPPVWIAVGVIVALGIGVVAATGKTKMKDPPGT